VSETAATNEPTPVARAEGAKVESVEVDAAREAAAENAETPETIDAPAAEASPEPAAEAAAAERGDETPADPAAEVAAEPAAAAAAAEAGDQTPADPAAEVAAEPAAAAAAAEAGDQTPADAAAEVAVPQAGAEEAPAAAAPAPAPAPKPGAPKPGAPRPGAPRPTQLRRPAAAPAAPAVPVPSAADEAAIAAAEAYGRVDEEGNVFVRETAGERAVGQFPGVTPSEAMSLYVRRYLDLTGKVSLFETRLSSADLSVKEIDQTLTRLREETAEPAAVGDLDALRERVASLGTVAAERRAALEEARAAAKAEAIAARTAIVEAAEKIAETDPQRMQWRPAGEELRTLLDSWKDAQRNGPRIDRTTEEALWKRFSQARTTFDRERRHYFAELEQRNSAAKAAKEKLVERAEALSSSTDWGATAGAYRDLMTEWKAAGRASRKDDDALWARFRAARDAQHAAVDSEYAANLQVKEAILPEAEAILPVTDIAAAKAALRPLQERWEAAGKVPRDDVQRVEGRMRAVEQAVRDAEQAQYARVNPEKRARAEGALAQLEAVIEGLEGDLAKAKAKGDARKVQELETALAARRSWLEQVARAAEDSRG